MFEPSKSLLSARFPSSAEASVLDSLCEFMGKTEINEKNVQDWLQNLPARLSQSDADQRPHVLQALSRLLRANKDIDLDKLCTFLQQKGCLDLAGVVPMLCLITSIFSLISSGQFLWNFVAR